ncbi:MAG: hypothetical protein QM504_03655 [Pseudomonadota bacterium]
MAKLPEKVKQIAIVHAQLINSVAMACQNKQLLPLLEPELVKAEQNGWTELIKRIRKILNGNRKTNLLINLDEEDAGIILAILVGIQNPNQLPKLNQVDKAKFAPEAISKLIHAYRINDIQAKELLDNMLVQMKSSEGDMKIMAFIIEKLNVNDLDIDALKRNMTEQGRQLIDDLMNKLDK